VIDGGPWLSTVAIVAVSGTATLEGKPGHLLIYLRATVASGFTLAGALVHRPARNLGPACRLCPQTLASSAHPT
jgi:hypothetical protein